MADPETPGSSPDPVDERALPLAERAKRTPRLRQPLHCRQLTMNGFERSDGLFDIVGELTDTKSYGFPNHDRGWIDADEPIHHMRLTLTLSEAYEILAIQAETLAGPYALCPAITPNFQRLVGLKIGPGWMRGVKREVGGIKGCTHLVEMLPPMATAAIQTMGPALARRRREEREARGEPEPPRTQRPTVLGTCHAYAADSPVVARVFPEFYEPDNSSEPTL